MSNWVNFKELRANLDSEQVLRHYGVEVKRKGNQHHGYCPLPGHQGKRNSPSFSVNLEKGIFQCFGCGAKGNILEFAALMEKVSLADGAALRKVALGLQQRFCIGSTTGQQAMSKSSETKPKPGLQAVVINKPLDFELKDLDHSHPYLASRGFVRQTIEHFALGFCARGMLANRIAIPLRNHKGELVGYAGRVVDDASIGEDNPRYRFPGKRERDGTTIEFRKTFFLYNGYSIKSPLDDLIVVEGFPSVWWLHQGGLDNVVATMGADCSERQCQLIVTLVKPSGKVWLIPDGDDAGTRFANNVLNQVSPYRFVRWLKVEPGRQPTDVPIAWIRSQMCEAIPKA
jgi:DNA primase